MSNTTNNTNVSIKATLVEEMQCYTLPYGGIGFVFHLLVYWMLYRLSIGKCPWRLTGLKLSDLDSWLAFAGLIGGVTLAIYSAVRCRHHWPLVLLAVWRIIFTIALCIAALIVADGVPTACLDFDEMFIILLFYLLGIVIQFAGLGLLARTSWADRRVRIMTGCLGGALLILFVAIRLNVPRGSSGRSWRKKANDWVWCALLAFSLMVGPYSDWLLGCIADNLGGVPQGDNILPYSYYMLANLFPLAFA
ncbi:hypothetical protein AOQ84DRAFT_371440 [Glonium stellatum]|uniref:Uncharacterized protein n=1 Tax=Glonium stellatum TaxID=574774 RepID=A0A8E2FBS1_9PEZI|nr:hypothetical protein AOQ84DRAFT_371440 [Glonium stellatum]